MRHLLFSLAACAAASALPLAAHAALKTEVFVEKTSVGPDGVAKARRLPAGVARALQAAGHPAMQTTVSAGQRRTSALAEPADCGRGLP